MPDNNVVARHFGSEEFTPEQLLLQALGDASNIEQLVIVTTDRDGMLQTGWSSGITPQNRVGLLEFAKLDVMRKAEKDA